MALLSESDRDVIIKRDYYQMKHRDIALQLGIDESAAQNRYHRAMIRLRGHLRPFVGDGA